jgi:hypothetical protein
MHLAEQLFHAARATVASGMAMLCRWNDAMGVSGNGGVCTSCADMPDGMAVAYSAIGYRRSLGELHDARYGWRGTS